MSSSPASLDWGFGLVKLGVGGIVPRYVATQNGLLRLTISSMATTNIVGKCTV